MFIAACADCFERDTCREVGPIYIFNLHIFHKTFSETSTHTPFTFLFFFFFAWKILYLRSTVVNLQILTSPEVDNFHKIQIATWCTFCYKISVLRTKLDDKISCNVH